MDLNRVYKFIRRNWFGLGWTVLLAFVLIAPKPGSSSFELMISLVSGFAVTAGLLLAANYYGLAERLRDRVIADRKRFRLEARWADRSIVFGRFTGVFFALWGCIACAGIALGYARGMLGVLLVALGGVGGVLIAALVSHGQ